jgi:hypothetical protein
MSNQEQQTKLGGEASSREAATSTVVLGTDSTGEQ